jgi:hypothetical protein
VTRGLYLALAIGLTGISTLHAQVPKIRGYYLNVPLWSDSTPLNVGGFGDLQRLRLMTSPALGPFDLEVAYEHLISYSERAVSQPVGAILGGLTPGGGEYWDLQWTIDESDHWLWRHRFDRLNLTVAPTDAADVTFGRQTISWATTLFLTPADPFVPFDPADPFREYRAGVDALRIQVYPGPFSDLDFVVRPTDTAVGRTITLLTRGRSVWKNWEISAWVGILHDEPAGALGLSGALGGTALRGEFSLREDAEDLALRGTVGVDRRYKVFDRDLYLVLEYQHDDYGAADADELLSAVLSEPFARGEMQVLGRDEVASQAAYQMHPLFNVSLLALWNLNDGSALIAPSAGYSLSNEIAIQAGLYLGLGEGVPETPETPVPPISPQPELRSEYGITPATAWLSVTAFF